MVIVFDLDDTLYDEIDFVKSGFHAVAEYLGDENETYFNWMWKTFLNDGSGTIFNRFLDTFKINNTLQELIDIYRYHKPIITLSQEATHVLTIACTLGKTALITDGDSKTQMAKYNALHLEQWIEYPIFTSLYATFKPELLAFQMIMKHFKNETKFVYIADNPKKDFLAPIELGWHTIRFKNPRGIYRSLHSNASKEVFALDEILTPLKAFAKEN